MDQTNEDKTGFDGREPADAKGREYRPKSFSQYIYLTFFWVMVGVSIIYGIRFWHDAPVHPSFVPLVAAVFSAILSFTLVIALEHVIGPIKIAFGPNHGFSGAGGPIVLWCICFLTITFGLYLLGVGELARQPISKSHVYCSVGDLLRGTCSPGRVETRQTDGGE